MDSFSFKNRHIIDTADLTEAEIGHLVEVADHIQALGAEAQNLCKGKVLGTLFWLSMGVACRSRNFACFPC